MKKDEKILRIGPSEGLFILTHLVLFAEKFSKTTSEKEEALEFLQRCIMRWAYKNQAAARDLIMDFLGESQDHPAAESIVIAITDLMAEEGAISEIADDNPEIEDATGIFVYKRGGDEK